MALESRRPCGLGIRVLVALPLLCAAAALWLSSASFSSASTATSSPTITASVSTAIAWTSGVPAPTVTADGSTWSAFQDLGAVTSNALWNVTVQSSALACEAGTGCVVGSDSIPASGVSLRTNGATGSGYPAGSSVGGACEATSQGASPGGAGCTLGSSQTLFTSASVGSVLNLQKTGTNTDSSAAQFLVTPGSAHGGTYSGTITFTASN